MKAQKATRQSNKEGKRKQKKSIDWRRTWQNNRYMLGLIQKAHPWIIPLSIISTVLGATSSFLTHTYLLSYALNAMQKGEPLKETLIVVGLIFIYALLCEAYWAWHNHFSVLHDPLVAASIQGLLQRKARSVELACFEDPEFYDTYVKATSEVENRTWEVLQNLRDVLWVLINTSATVTLMFTIDPIFILIALLPLIYTLLTGKRRTRIKFQKHQVNKICDRRKDYVRRTFYLSDYSKEMRLGEMWKVMFRQMSESIREQRGNYDKYGYPLMWFSYASCIVGDILVYFGAILLASFKTLVRRTMLLGDCFVVINSISNIAYNLSYTGAIFLKLDENSLYIDNLRAFLDYESKMPEDPSAPLPDPFASLELKSVGFTYKDQDCPALSGIDLSIRQGERIAIVGHNGAGKTTLVKLLLRLYDPTEGQILYNGKDIREYRLSSYRDRFGCVFQDYRLFAVSVAENVMLKGDLSEEERKTVADALERSGMAEKINHLPLGMDTNVTREFDKEGAMFSGGEAQKISIARIFAGSQEIVLLDEPTSALDPIAEQEMYANMFAACEGKTVIFISHRLSCATSADRVYLFENGRIIEQGTHSQLLAGNGKYADMWHKQADTYMEAEGEVST